MRLQTAVIAALALPFCLADGAGAQASNDPDCIYSMASVPRGAPAYSQFPAGSVPTAAPAPAVIDSPGARTFRTRIREGAKTGPNFAGHFTIIRWGCGTDCQMGAVVDALTGKVFIDPTVTAIWSGRVHDDANTKAAPGEHDGFSERWRRDSSLLIALGAPGEDMRRDGVGYYNWTGTKFVLVKQYAAKDICRHRPDGE